jgi:hypothetical protein
MGAVLETVSVALTTGTVTAFGKSLFGWLGRRRDAAKVTLKIKRSDGHEEIELTCGSDDDAASVLTALRGFLDQGA